MSARPLWIVVAMAVSLGVLALVWHLRQSDQLVGQIQAELATLPDNEVETSMRRFAELGETGLNGLTEALTSDRAAVRDASHRVLLEEVDRWELLSESAIAPRLESLAKGLAVNALRMDADSRRFAADLALRLLLWPHEAEGRPSPWMADCEAVLETTAGNRHPNGNKSPTILANPASATVQSPRSATPSLADLATSLADKVQLPGGDLPLEISPMPAGGGFVEPQVVRNEPTPSLEPRRLQVPINSRALDSDNSGSDHSGSDNSDPDDDDDDSQPGATNRPARLPSVDGNARPTAVGLQARKQSVGGPAANDKAAWQQLPPRDVMRRLHVSDPQVVQAARVELERRGIKGSLVDLARRATDPDPKVRRRLAEALPSIPGVDAKPWLVELSYDVNAQVRATAVTLMATSGDLDLVHRLEQIARDDPDDYTRAQAAKALAPRQR
jgi:hypothetical protein